MCGSGPPRRVTVVHAIRSPVVESPITVSSVAVSSEIVTDWWRHAVVYQVYLRSFSDGNGDGTGDIAGMRSRLQYLERLGVDAVWINPWYRSPLLDGGYDVAEYRSINEQFGTTTEAEEFIADARRSRRPPDRLHGVAITSSTDEVTMANFHPTTGSRCSAARRGLRSQTVSGTSICSTRASLM
jgi:hypothetical protein